MSNMFLGFGLLFPRLTLLVGYFLTGLPPNDTPFAVDVLAAIVAPRLLLAWWAYAAGYHPLVAAIFVLIDLRSVATFARPRTPTAPAA